MPPRAGRRIVRAAHPMKVAYAALTDVGLVRQNNEDAYVVCLAKGRHFIPPPASNEGVAEADARGALFAVADGMGGALAGEVASKMAVEALAQAVDDLRAEDDDEAARDCVLEAIRIANERIYEASASNPQHRGMGTTLTAALIRDGRCLFFQVGDSKGFISREKQLHQMTEDQSLIGKLIHDKVITPEDAEHLEGGRNIILQALGAEPTVKVDVSTSSLFEGDAVLLCTDGLHGSVRQKELEEMVGRAGDSGKLAEDLVREARDRGGPDNITVVVISVLEGAAEPKPPGLLARLAGIFKKP
jgi:serine/threonine protein phosphatase PrpC